MLEVTGIRGVMVNQKGTSLIEVVVMSGVMVALMVGFMSMMNHETEGVAYLEDKLSRVALESELRTRFANPTSCEGILHGTVAPPKNNSKDLTQLAAFDQVFQKRGNAFFYDKLKIKKISMEGSDLTAPNSAGTVDLMFYSERTRKGGGPSSLQPVKIKTLITVGTGYTVESCRLEGDAAANQSCVVTADQVKAPLERVRHPVGSTVAEGTAIQGTREENSGGHDGTHIATHYQYVCIGGRWVYFLNSTNYF